MRDPTTKKPLKERGKVQREAGRANLHPQYSISFESLKDLYSLLGQAIMQDRPHVACAIAGLIEKKRGIG